MNSDEYRKLAAVEDQMWYFRALHAHVGAALGREVLTGRGLRILDAGCGTGGLIRRLAPRSLGVEWRGIDLEPLAVALARERTAAVRGVEIREGSVTALPWGAEAFAAVVSADVIYHVDDDGAALREFWRVLRPGGRLVINVPAYKWLWSYHDVATHAKRRYDRVELMANLTAAGFGEVRATHWNALPLPLVVARRKLWPAPAGGSDVGLFPAPVEAVFNAGMAVERAWLRTGLRLPWGSSLLATARKPVG